MADKMRPIPFEHMFHWILQEYSRQRRIFGIPEVRFFRKAGESSVTMFGESLETPLGPAAGPHTQLTQNIIAAYLVGGRFFELKTVQKLDRLEIDKPCIDAQDEGYNVEWSQELRLEQSYDEYLKAWFLLHFLKEAFGLSDAPERGFVFNMSVGYDLEGIRTGRMDRFINQLKDATLTETFEQYRRFFRRQFEQSDFRAWLKEVAGSQTPQRLDRLQEMAEAIPAAVSGSVTLSTMHGCPPDEIEAIARYLIAEKGLHTYVKLNPTLLGFETVREILNQLGYRYMSLDPGAFEHDLQYSDAVPMLQRLQEFAETHGKRFGVKLSNTLGMKNTLQRLPGGEMYMSGRSLFPLTIRLAARLAAEFDGRIEISYSGGATAHNVSDILRTGIFPVTLVTELLKPGGYLRLARMVEQVEQQPWRDWASRGIIDVSQVQKLADEALQDRYYHKERREVESIKIGRPLPRTDCYLSPCREACPIHQDVAEYIRLVEEGRYLEAFKVIVETNPLPHITGYICDHPCMEHCTRWDYEDPVYIREMKRVAAEAAFREYLQKYGEPQKAPSNGVPVAVVGAGPAGLAAAYFLTRAGFQVTVFEKEQSAGGVVQHVIPPFRLPQHAIDRDVEWVRRQGVKFEFGVQEKFSVQELKSRGFRYIFLGIGAGKSRRLTLAGEGGQMLDALEFLREYRREGDARLGRTVAVVGGGNSAMDAARAAKRCTGVETVYILYRRTRQYMPADREEYEEAIADGVIFRELLLPVEWEDGRLKCQKMALGERDADGRRRVDPVEGEYLWLQVDTVISAIGEEVDYRPLVENGILFDERQRVMVNPQTNETTVENVFIGGDALRGPSSVVEAMADGKKAAEAIIRKEGGKPETPPDFRTLFDNTRRVAQVTLRKGVVTPMNTENHQDEAARCLACNLICDKCVEVCPNRANIAIPVPSANGEFRDMSQIVHIDGMCNECGNCETFCPYQGAPYKEKITLFWSEEDFADSSNEGFYLLSQNGTAVFRVRYGGKIGEVELDAQGNPVQSPWPEGDSGFGKFLQVLKTVYRDYSYLLVGNSKSQFPNSK